MTDKKWTLELAQEEWEHKGQEANPDNIRDDKLTEADHYFADLALKAAAEPDPIRRAKIMHCGITYTIPFLNNLPKPRNPDGSLMNRDEQEAHLVATIIRLYIEDCEAGGDKPSRSLINKVKKFRFDKLDRDDWHVLFDAMAGGCEDSVTQDFQSYAYKQWVYYSIALRGT